MPGQLTINPRRAGASLKVVVVGGGLAGIATAFTLQRAGHNVTVVERTDGKARSHGGIRSPPNMTRVLTSWGLGPALAKLAVRCRQFLFHQPDGELLGLVQLHEDFLVDLMGDFIFIQHGDLQSMLLDLATHEGVQFRYNCTVESVDTENIGVVVVGGERFDADFVVGAEGPESLVRTAVMTHQITGYADGPNSLVRTAADEHITGYADGHLSLTMAIPTDVMREDKDLRTLADEGNWWVWLGPSTLIHGSLVSGRKEFTVVIGLQGVPPETLAKYDESWDKSYPIEHFGIDFSTYDIRVQKLMKLVKKVTPTVHIRRPILESSVCHLARLVIVGEAAHPLVPAGQHNAGLAMEDAETLGALFTRIQHRSQVQRVLAGFEEIRQPRCNYAQNWELRKRIMMSAPLGPEQKKRDEGIRRMAANFDWEHIDETRFREMWGDEMEMFCHSSTEAVEDWWAKWGSLLARDMARDTATGAAPAKSEVPSTPTMQVNVSTGQQRSMIVY
ncbi:hypothetical protein C8F04DRAFT_188589 [Mycena alexandri]|uniref:FAD-binding domain-containing protein n=1 Tax=Mycena alexandri TaxID=1745969 RepID=A0AAD6T881_9AGAR|nr:hypothetical protein C8F04DRAFT_224570 [Mycena alexandri]KAJ7041083.1 hypothetical protein C8F04DRAFT_188589 [Mycena alexandri]